MQDVHKWVRLSRKVVVLSARRILKLLLHILRNTFNFFIESDSMQHASPSIILRRVAYGDADWIVTFFTRDRGRMSGMARSARKSIKRFGGALEPGSIVDLRYTDKGSGGLVRLEEALIDLPTHGILKSLERIERLGRTLLLALAFLQEGEANPDKFNLLRARIASLAAREPLPHEGLRFEIDWLARCGYAPQIEGCARCGTEHPQGAWAFDLNHGGIVCFRCRDRKSQCIPLSEEARQGFAMLTVGEKHAGPAVAATSVIARYVDHIVGRPLKTSDLSIQQNRVNNAW
jgi:DNA repair protein RecO (recombination protein O)